MNISDFGPRFEEMVEIEKGREWERDKRTAEIE
jgi:hypothetical protein